MKQSILRTFPHRLIGDSASFADAWKADPASVGLMQRLFAFCYKWYFTCSSMLSTCFAAFHKPVKRAEYMPESITVEQTCLAISRRWNAACR
ncbi:hypothetical protein GZH47_31755 (plasmid) [Paenibacillus rhizovicinus]|uniref:Uncharacterized protein n=1 Tax=Paenibacillus rhizovicinus TaxID=2704463 RepID=A0A6C0PCB5_9BACL|nr:hypothetical protein [Paenibacillus rhizovicinus]QHW35473.1 hypothetical protein GZH47_31755 [Paenibacillus rhizovicinus]